jgi:hypothetical protein
MGTFRYGTMCEARFEDRLLAHTSRLQREAAKRGVLLFQLEHGSGLVLIPEPVEPLITGSAPTLADHAIRALEQIPGRSVLGQWRPRNPRPTPRS